MEKTGLQTLDGVQALCYGRIRKGDTGDDWARVERQSVVLNAIFTKLQSASATELIAACASWFRMLRPRFRRLIWRR